MALKERQLIWYYKMSQSETENCAKCEVRKLMSQVFKIVTELNQIETIFYQI